MYDEMINTNMYYVYIYKTPINITVSHMSILANQPFYIGKGRGRRLKVHLRGSSCNPLFNNKIEQIKRTT